MLAIAAGFAQSITENTTLDTIIIIGNVIFFSITENTAIADTPAIKAAFIESLTENFISADTNSQQSAFQDAVIEALLVLDSFAVRGWFSINDSETPNWQLVKNIVYTYNQAMMLGGAAFASVPFSTVAGSSSIAGQNWVDINQNESTVWAEIDDSQ